jgi:methionine-rich copper-binding protein CopC
MSLLIRAAAAAGLFAAIVSAGPAAAHAFLDAADPPVGGAVAAPKAVTITFTEELEPVFSTIQVFDGGGARVDKNDAHIVDGDATRFAVDLPPLKPGTYKVVWHATSVDTHKTSGAFSFTVTP